MKKLILLFLLLIAGVRASAQQPPCTPPCGLTDTVASLTSLIDSVERGALNPFLKKENASVIEYTFVLTRAKKDVTYFETVKGEEITPRVKARIKSAEPGDKIVIINVKVVQGGKEVTLQKATRYTLQ